MSMLLCIRWRTRLCPALVRRYQPAVRTEGPTLGQAQRHCLSSRNAHASEVANPRTLSVGHALRGSRTTLEVGSGYESAPTATFKATEMPSTAISRVRSKPGGCRQVHAPRTRRYRMRTIGFWAMDFDRLIAPIEPFKMEFWSLPTFQGIGPSWAWWPRSIPGITPIVSLVTFCHQPKFRP